MAAEILLRCLSERELTEKEIVEGLLVQFACGKSHESI
jgi:hypothetical protein